MSKVVIIFSGGMDSYTLLCSLVGERAVADVYGLSFDYGQRHVKELNYARQQAEGFGITHTVLDLTVLQQVLRGSALTSDVDVPEGHYEDESMKATVVPNRNMIMLSIAVGYAVSLKAQEVLYAAHSGDHAIYPDCRPEFINRMNEVCAVANYEEVKIRTPFIFWSKGDIAKLGMTFGIDYDRETWTCYKGEQEPCGKCGACVERREALIFAGYYKKR